jgi:exodeoxyribonuclease VII large subunit
MIRLINTGKDFIIRAGITPANQSSRLFSFALSNTERLRSHLKDLESAVLSNSISYSRRKESEINSLNNSLNLLSPLNVLKRGYTITSIRGKIMKSAGMAETGETIDTLFTDGTISSRVTTPSRKRR